MRGAGETAASNLLARGRTRWGFWRDLGEPGRGVGESQELLAGLGRDDGGIGDGGGGGGAIVLKVLGARVWAGEACSGREGDACAWASVSHRVGGAAAGQRKRARDG